MFNFIDNEFYFREWLCRQGPSALLCPGAYKTAVSSQAVLYLYLLPHNVISGTTTTMVLVGLLHPFLCFVVDNQASVKSNSINNIKTTKISRCSRRIVYHSTVDQWPKQKYRVPLNCRLVAQTEVQSTTQLQTSDLDRSIEYHSTVDQ